MSRLFDSTTATIRRLTRRAKAAYVGFRSRSDDRVNLYALVRRDAPMPEGIRVVSRPTATRPKSELRYAASYEIFTPKGWVPGLPTHFEPEILGEWVIEATNIDVASHGEAKLADGRWLLFPHLNVHAPRGHSVDGVVEEITEPVWIVQNGSNAFGHWLLHVLPRIHRARQLDPNKRILTRHPGWNPSGLLEMVGLSMDDIVWFPRDESNGSYVHVKHGTFISHAAPRGNTVVNPLDSIRFDSLVEDFVEKAKDIASPFGKKLYVSRSTKDPMAKRDGCQNREELEKYFAAQGFEVIYPERFPFVEQVAIFRDAEFIIAEGGSAPHNVLFSRPGIKLMYIAARLAPGNNHWQLRIADYKRLNYRLLTPTEEFSQRKYTVDMDMVKRAYETLSWPTATS